jgi:primosomal protein N' (replication factor Y)
MVQTLAPSASSIEHAAAHDSEGFLGGELERRRILRYPPYSHLLRVNLSSSDEGKVDAAATAIAAELRTRLPAESELLGPAPMFRVRGRHRRRILVKAQDRAGTVAAAGATVERRAADRALKDVSIGVDVDPT